MLNNIIDNPKSPDLVPLGDLENWVRELKTGKGAFTAEEARNFYDDHLIRNVQAAVVEGKDFEPWFQSVARDLSIPPDKRQKTKILFAALFDEIKKAYDVSIKLGIHSKISGSFMQIAELSGRKYGENKGLEAAKKALEFINQEENRLGRKLTESERREIVNRYQSEGLSDALISGLKETFGKAPEGET